MTGLDNINEHKAGKVSSSEIVKPSLPGSSAKDTGIEYGNAQDMHDKVMPDKLEPVGEKPKTIIDETYREAMARGKYTPAEWLSTNIEAAKNGEREPLSVGEYIEVLRDSDDLNETPEQKKKREKREAAGRAIRGLGNVVANIANFVGATQGAVPGEYNIKEATHREQEIENRRQALKEKYDSIILNAKMGDERYARDLRTARERTEADRIEKDRSYDARQQKAEADAVYRQAVGDERARHNREMEAVARRNSDTSRQRANSAAQKQANVARPAQNGKDDELVNKMISFVTKDMPDKERKEYEGYIRSRTPEQLVEQFGGVFSQLDGNRQENVNKAPQSGAVRSDSDSKKLGLGIGENKKRLGIGLGK